MLAADCKSVKTGSIPVPASNIFNSLRNFCGHIGLGLKRALKHSRSALVLFCAVAGVLRTPRQFALADPAAVFLQHLHA